MRLVGDNGWGLERVEVATSFAQRWRGLMATDPRPVLIRGSSVHGFWLRGDLWVVGLDTRWRVIRVGRLRRRSIVWVRGAARVLELPLDQVPPTVGTRLTCVVQLGEADPYGRPSGPLRHADRQSG